MKPSFAFASASLAQIHVVAAGAIFAATVTWELNKHHDFEDAYYKAKAALKPVYGMVGRTQSMILEQPTGHF